MESVLLPTATATCKGPPSLATTNEHCLANAANWFRDVFPHATRQGWRILLTISRHNCDSAGPPNSIICAAGFSINLSANFAKHSGGQRLYTASFPQLSPPPGTRPMTGPRTETPFSFRNPEAQSASSLITDNSLALCLNGP